MDEFIDPKGTYYYDLVAKRRKIRVARNPKDISTFVTLLCTYFMYAQPLEIFVYI
jgi:hypothetical protein